jgi:hypothetical protein
MVPVPPARRAVGTGTIRFGPLPPACQQDAGPRWQALRRTWALATGNEWKRAHPHLTIAKSVLRCVRMSCALEGS